jgi:hypothetical protein
MQADEAQLLQQQQARAAVDAAAEDGELPDADPLAPQDATAARVAQRNGERESLGVSSGVLQVLCCPGNTSQQSRLRCFPLDAGEPLQMCAAILGASPRSGG